jgi:transcriptional regulator with XRE-family HTH domain
VGSSRIAGSLRAARDRLGWSRETLAHHSGVSWSAISQIESGRRKDVRLSSLSALADALGVSVDYLIGTAAVTTPPRLAEHRVLAYESDEEFLAAAIPFLTEGIEQSHCLLAVLTPAKTELLRDALGGHAEHIEFADWADWYRSPKEALRRYGEFVKQKLEGGAVWIRVLGEAAWAGESDAEIAAWARYESLVNILFRSSPATLICTYDKRSFPVDRVAEALLTHPAVAHNGDVTDSPMYREPEDFLLEPQT